MKYISDGTWFDKGTEAFLICETFEGVGLFKGIKDGEEDEEQCSFSEFTKIFDTYEIVEDSFNCRKLPIIMKAKQMDCEFRVNSLEGDYCQGKAGDYLMTGTKGEHWIIDKEIFEETYEVL